MDEKNLSTAPHAKARRRFTTEERHAILERYRASGLSQVRFAEVEGIALATLTCWLRKERDGGVKPEGAETPVEVGQLGSLVDPSQWAEVVSPDGLPHSRSGRGKRPPGTVSTPSLPKTNPSSSTIKPPGTAQRIRRDVGVHP